MWFTLDGKPQTVVNICPKQTEGDVLTQIYQVQILNTSQNPADLGTRGITSEELVHSKFRVTAWALLFVRNLRKKSTERKELTVQ